MDSIQEISKSGICRSRKRQVSSPLLALRSDWPSTWSEYGLSPLAVYLPGKGGGVDFAWRCRTGLCYLYALRGLWDHSPARGRNPMPMMHCASVGHCICFILSGRGGRSPFQRKDLPKDSPRKLFAMGFLTNLLNPEVAVMYLSLLPQFITPAQGDVLSQSLVLGFMQIVISVSVNAGIVIAAGMIASFLSTRPTWLVVQRWLMGAVLADLVLRLATQARR